jgi:hypothetical protein
MPEKNRSTIRRAYDGRSLRFEMLERRALLTVYNFSPHSDVDDGADGSLRQAIQLANSDGNDDLIVLEPGVYDLTIGNGGMQENAAAKGDLDLTEANHSITIRGAGAGATTIDAHLLDRIFHVAPDVTFVLSNVSIRNGQAQDDGANGAVPGSRFFSGGGGILGETGSSITLNNVALEQSVAVGGAHTWGGGIYTLGNVSIDHCLIGGNSAIAAGAPNSGNPADGGGIYVEAGASLTIANSTLSNNKAVGGMATSSGIGGVAQGGGIFAFGQMSFSNSRATGNRAVAGAGLSNAGGAAQGGAFCLIADATINNAFFAGNRALGGAGSNGPNVDDGEAYDGGAAQGGSIYSAFGHMLIMTNSRLTRSEADGGRGGTGGAGVSFGGDGGRGGNADGGALALAGTGTLTADTLDVNDALGGKGGDAGSGSIAAGIGGDSGNGRGGAISLLTATATVINSTISENEAADAGGGTGGLAGLVGLAAGGGIYVSGGSTLSAYNTTISENFARDGGGIYNDGSVSAFSTIIGLNQGHDAHPDYFGPFETADHVLLQDSRGASGIDDGANGNIVGQDPLLGPLAYDDGGGTPSKPLVGSPAINAGVNPLGLTSDIRGFARPINAIDIGSVEFQAPQVKLSGTATFKENGTSLVLAPNASVTDVDNRSFDGGTLTVTITNNANANDRLQIKNQGTGAGQIGISGSDVSFSGVVIGNFSGGTGAEPLVVTFNVQVDAIVAQALVRVITFRTISEDPSTTPRTITFAVSDGDGFSSDPATATKTVNVTAVNDAPRLSFSGTMGYVHDKPAVTLAAFATVSDVDSPNFDQGRLRVRITDGANSSNRLSIGTGFTVNASGDVLQGTSIIGKRVSNGFGTNELVITFNTNATKAVVQQLVRAITFKTVGGAAGQRKVVFTVSDGDGGLSAEATKTVNVS